MVGSDDVTALSDVFSDIDETFFRPHPLTDGEARRIADHLWSLRRTARRVRAAAWVG